MKIDSDVPIPPPVLSGKPIYPFGEMKVGDSFALEPRAGDTVQNVTNRLRTSARQWGKRQNRSAKFAVRTTETGCRIWRVA